MILKFNSLLEVVTLIGHASFQTFLSQATRAVSEIFNDDFAANLDRQSLTVKEMWKSVNIGRRCKQV